MGITLKDGIIKGLPGAVRGPGPGFDGKGLNSKQRGKGPGHFGLGLCQYSVGRGGLWFEDDMLGTRIILSHQCSLGTQR